MIVSFFLGILSGEKLDKTACCCILEKGVIGEIYNIGCDEGMEYSVLDVANLFGGQIEMLPARQGNRLSAKVITDKTRELGWEPKYDLNTYIETLRQHGWCE